MLDVFGEGTLDTQRYELFQALVYLPAPPQQSRASQCPRWRRPQHAAAAPQARSLWASSIRRSSATTPLAVYRRKRSHWHSGGPSARGVLLHTQSPSQCGARVARPVPKGDALRDGEVLGSALP